MGCKKRNNAGFTLVEIIVTLTLTSLVIALSGSFLNFSFSAQRKVDAEYDLQSQARLAAEVLNNEVRNATVMFTIPEDSFTTKQEEWNYFGIEKNEIVQYTWNISTKKHDKVVLLPMRSEYDYSLVFTQRLPKQDAVTGAIEHTKLLQFQLDCIPKGGKEKAISIGSELEALNSVTVDHNGSIKNPAVAIAYRTDPAPQPKVETKNIEVTVAVTLVLDKSGSMDYTMGGSGPDSDKKRMTLLSNQAKALIDQFAKQGYMISIIPFSDNANNPGDLLDSKVTKNVTTLKEKINGLTSNGGTNTGDGLRRAYYTLKNFNDDKKNSGKEIVNYIILLNDGLPTYYSKDSKQTDGYLRKDGNASSKGGGGSNDNDGKSIGYAKVIGKELIVGGSLDIHTFVIGFSGVAGDVAKSEQIAAAAKSATNPKRTGVYYSAGSELELQKTFESITETILSDTWHIYGPYKEGGT